MFGCTQSYELARVGEQALLPHCAKPIVEILAVASIATNRRQGFDPAATGNECLGQGRCPAPGLPARRQCWHHMLDQMHKTHMDLQTSSLCGPWRQTPEWWEAPPAQGLLRRGSF